MSENSKVITMVRLDNFKAYNFQTVNTFTINQSSTITTYPTSVGTPKADNIYHQPVTISANVTVGGSEVIQDEWSEDTNGVDRAKNAENILTSIKNNAIELSLTTPQGYFTNMYLTGISHSNTNQNALNFNATLTFSELPLAEFETITVGPFKSGNYSANDNSTQNSGTNNGSSNNIVNEVIEKGKDVVGKTTTKVVSEAISAGAAIGTGAAAGALIGGPIGAIIGAGIGGLIHIFR